MEIASRLRYANPQASKKKHSCFEQKAPREFRLDDAILRIPSTPRKLRTYQTETSQACSHEISISISGSSMESRSQVSWNTPSLERSLESPLHHYETCELTKPSIPELSITKHITTYSSVHLGAREGVELSAEDRQSKQASNHATTKPANSRSHRRWSAKYKLHTWTWYPGTCSTGNKERGRREGTWTSWSKWKNHATNSRYSIDAPVLPSQQVRIVYMSITKCNFYTWTVHSSLGLMGAWKIEGLLGADRGQKTFLDALSFADSVTPSQRLLTFIQSRIAGFT